MGKIIYTSIAVMFILSGCGGGTEKETTSTDPKNTTNTTQNTPVDKSIGKTTGSYNLWEYVVPAQSNQYSFVEKSGDKSGVYNTTYSKNENIVTEISDYAQDEKTIYTKKSDRILVEFEKNGNYNGEYSLNLTSNIGESVTIKESTCKLTKHYDKIEISSKEFADVIEINCEGKPGYYQRGKGEIAQTSLISSNGQIGTRVLTN